MERARFASGVLGALVCMGVGGLSGGCDSSLGGVVTGDQDQLARDAADLAPAPDVCGPGAVPNDLGGYDVLPSGDHSGLTDRRDMDCALAEMGSGGVTTLAGSDFYLDREAKGLDVLGTLRGLGRDLTTVHAVDGFGLDPSWFAYPAIIALHYDDQIAGGQITISDLTITANGSTAPIDWNNDTTTIPYGIGVSDDPYYLDRILDLDITYEHLGAMGVLDPANPVWGSNLGFPFAATIQTSGDVVMQDITGSGVSGLLEVGDLRGGHVVIGGSEQDAVVGKDLAQYDVEISPRDDTDVEVSHLHVDGGLLGTFYLPGGGGNAFTLTDSTFTNPIWYGVYANSIGVYDTRQNSIDVVHNVVTGTGGIPDGIAISDSAFGNFGVSTVDATVSRNTVDLVTPFGGIFGWEVQGMVVSENTISGELVAGIYFSPLSGPTANDLLIANDVQGVVPVASPYLGFTPAQIYLDPETEDCVVIGRQLATTDVVDEGVDNILVGVNNQGRGQDLGSDLQVMADPKRAALHAAALLGSPP